MYNNLTQLLTRILNPLTPTLNPLTPAPALAPTISTHPTAGPLGTGYTTFLFFIALIYLTFHTGITSVSEACNFIFLNGLPSGTLGLVIGVILLPEAIQNLLALVAVFISAIVLLIYAGAEFLAFLLLIVYVGAIIILFVFVIMLLYVKLLPATIVVLVAGVAADAQALVPVTIIGIDDSVSQEILAFFVASDFLAFATEPTSVSSLIRFITDQAVDIQPFNLLYKHFGFLFFLIGGLLLSAMIGAIVLATMATDADEIPRVLLRRREQFKSGLFVRLAPYKNQLSMAAAILTIFLFAIICFYYLTIPIEVSCAPKIPMPPTPGDGPAPVFEDPKVYADRLEQGKILPPYKTGWGDKFDAKLQLAERMWASTPPALRVIVLVSLLGLITLYIFGYVHVDSFIWGLLGAWYNLGVDPDAVKTVEDLVTLVEAKIKSVQANGYLKPAWAEDLDSKAKELIAILQERGFSLHEISYHVRAYTEEQVRKAVFPR